MAKNTTNRIVSKINNICRLIFEKNNNFGLMKAKNVSIHKNAQIVERAITDLKFLKFSNIQKQYLIYINII